MKRIPITSYGSFVAEVDKLDRRESARNKTSYALHQQWGYPTLYALAKLGGVLTQIEFIEALKMRIEQGRTERRVKV